MLSHLQLLTHIYRRNGLFSLFHGWRKLPSSLGVTQKGFQSEVGSMATIIMRGSIRSESHACRFWQISPPFTQLQPEYDLHTTESPQTWLPILRSLLEIREFQTTPGAVLLCLQ